MCRISGGRVGAPNVSYAHLDRSRSDRRVGRLFRRRRNPRRSAVDRDADRGADAEILIVCGTLAVRDRERLIVGHANSDTEGDGHSVRAANVHVSGSAPDDRELYRLPDG